MSESERLQETLQKALAQHGPLLKTAPLPSLLREAATAILQAVAAFLQEWDSQINDQDALPKTVVREALSLLLEELGPGDAQVRQAVLQVLPLLQRCETRQVLLDFLPCTMPIDEDLEEATEQVIDALRVMLLSDGAMLLPILGCLSILPVAESGRCESFQVAVTSLPMVSESELPVLVRTLLRHVATEEEAIQSWTALRDEFKLLEQSEQDDADVDDDPLGLVAHVVLSSFADSTNGVLLVQSYIKVLESASARSEGSACLLLDFLALLAMSQRADACDAADRILDSWLATDRFPFDTLESVLPVVCGNQKFGQPTCLLYSKLSPSLLRLGIFLLLAPARGSLTLDTLMEPIQAFILKLHHRLDRELQGELVHSLLHLSQEAATGWDTKARRGRKRPRTHVPAANFQRVIHQSVHRILLTLAASEPRSLVRFKHILTERLTSTNVSPADATLDSTRELCAILSRLVESDRVHNGGGLDSSEAMMLLQKLLFSSSGAFGRSAGNSARVVRGILLATELVRLPSLSKDDKDCIKQWVLRILLPATRRMVDPELGSPGLTFLEAWSSGGDAVLAKEVFLFQHFKMILANTGLIQILAHYEQTRKKDNTVLGYTKIPNQFAYHGSAAKGKQRAMVFCVNFFLRQKDMHCPSRWRDSTQWVYELVDTYLRMGREKATNGWVPNGWLQAAVEFPSLAIALEPSATKRASSVDWIQHHLSSFEVSARGLSEPEGLIMDIGELIADSHDRKAIKQLLDSLFQHALTFLIGIGLSAAVLNNAFDHYRNQSSEDSTRDANLFPLIHFQILKIYDLRSKLRTVGCLLSALKIALGRMQKAPRRNGNVKLGRARTEEPADALEPQGPRRESTFEITRLLAEIEFASSQIRNLDATLFSTDDFIDRTVLWECLCDSKHTRTIRQSLASFTGNEPSVGGCDYGTAACLVELNTRLLDHLASLEVGASGGKEVYVLHIIESSLFLVKSLPKIRKHHAVEQDKKEAQLDIGYPSVTRLSAAYLQLVVHVLTQSTKPRYHTSSLESTDDILTFKRVLELFQSAANGLDTSTEREGTGSPVANCICDTLLDCLSSTDDGLIAHQLLEILSILAIQEKGVRESVNQANWTSLHTIYSEESMDGFKLPLPYAFGQGTLRFRSLAVSSELLTLQRALEGTILKSSSALETSQGSSLFQYGLIRHWGLLTQFESTVSVLESHLYHLVSELESFLGGLEGAIDDDSDDEKKDTDDVLPTKKRRPVVVSAIPWLSGSTFVDFFELLLHMIVSATAVAAPATKATSSTYACGPYNHLDAVCRMFSSVVDVYQKHCLVFPRRVASKVSNACRFMLSSTVSQLHRCIDWRNRQPLLSRSDKEANAYDAGSMKYLDTLLDCMAANTAGRIHSLCDFWQSTESASQYASKSTTLSYAAEKASRAFKAVAASHNLTDPVFELDEADQQRQHVTSRSSTKGFHQLDGATVRSKKRRVATELLTKVDDSGTPKGPPARLPMEEDEGGDNDVGDWEAEDSDDGEASSGSFGASGDWGDDDDDDDSDDESTGMLNLQSSLPFLRTSP